MVPLTAAQEPKSTRGDHVTKKKQGALVPVSALSRGPQKREEVEGGKKELCPRELTRQGIIQGTGGNGKRPDTGGGLGTSQGRLDRKEKSCYEGEGEIKYLKKARTKWLTEGQPPQRRVIIKNGAGAFKTTKKKTAAWKAIKPL